MRRALSARLSRLFCRYAISAPPLPLSLVLSRPLPGPTMPTIGFVCADCRRSFLGGAKRLSGGAGTKGGAENEPPNGPSNQPSNGTGDGAEDGAENGAENASGDGDGLARFLGVDAALLGGAERTAFGRLLAQSDFAAPGAKAVDRRTRHLRPPDWALWEGLLRFRQRVFGAAGVRVVWRGMRVRELDLHAPNGGAPLDAVWRMLAAAALQDAALADELLLYARALSARHNHKRQWAPLYDTLMLPLLAQSAPGDRALSWHWRLFPVFTSQSWPALFAAAWAANAVWAASTAGPTRPDGNSSSSSSSSARCHHNMRLIHATLPRPMLYARVVGNLCHAGLPHEALRWAKHCAAHGDLPADSTATDPLVALAARHGSSGLLRAVLAHVTRLAALGVPLVESTAVAAAAGLAGLPRPAARRAADLLVLVPGGLPARLLGDGFWHALFCSRLSPRDVFGCAVRAGPGGVAGARTVRLVAELLGRDCRAAAALLRMAGLDAVPPPPSGHRYKTRHASNANSGNTSNTGNTGNTGPDSAPPNANQKLQTLLQRKQLRAALDLVAHMCAAQSPLAPGSVRLLVRTLLRPRRRGKLPAKTPYVIRRFGADVDVTVSLLLALQRAGTPVAWPLWRELLRRLGMAGELPRLERLALTLARLYAPDTGPDPDPDPNSPRRRLFTPTMLRALVEWGLLDGRDPAWGVRLVHQLKALGVPVDVRSVRRSVRVRLARHQHHPHVTAAETEELAAIRRKLAVAWHAPLWAAGPDELQAQVAHDRRAWLAFRHRRACEHRQMRARWLAHQPPDQRPAAERRPVSGGLTPALHAQPVGRRARRAVSLRLAVRPGE